MNLNTLMKIRNSRDSAAHELLRFIFYGSEKLSGTERAFFIELALVNPSISPDATVLGYKTRVNIKPEDLQNVLVGSVATKSLATEKIVTPSFVAVRAGAFGENSKQVVKYLPVKNCEIGNKSLFFKGGDCVFNGQALTGRIELSKDDITAHPEYFCDAGIAAWSLQYRIQHTFQKGYSGKSQHWAVPGGRVEFSGSFNLDGVEYVISSQKYPGYIEHFWGKDLCNDWFHLSSTNLISVISGHTLKASNFTVHGVYDDRISILLNIEGRQIFYTSDMGRHAYNAIWDVTESPDNNAKEPNGQNLHWSVSIHSKQYVLDVDVFSGSDNLCMRPWELACGNRKMLKVLAGSQGLGEIRLYKKMHKDLILIEQARLIKTFCEYGKVEGQM